MVKKLLNIAPYTYVDGEHVGHPPVSGGNLWGVRLAPEHLLTYPSRGSGSPVPAGPPFGRRVLRSVPGRDVYRCPVEQTIKEPVYIVLRLTPAGRGRPWAFSCSGLKGRAPGTGKKCLGTTEAKALGVRIF
ncbi:MAG: hypothetical protein QXQ66_07990 [Candidatus Hadarchaeum sp.]|uniref:hypothetical protein n=1 Tax=Candidatus Hadarchaeum sp. TaxID=2883567 RepID=UPI00317881A6